MLDDVDSDLENKTTFNNFNQWSDDQKLYALSQKTHELYKRANEFDQKMLALNKQFNFLDNEVENDLKKVKTIPKKGGNKWDQNYLWWSTPISINFTTIDTIMFSSYEWKLTIRTIDKDFKVNF